MADPGFPPPHYAWEKGCWREQQKTWREQEFIADRILESLTNIRDRVAALSLGCADLEEACHDIIRQKCALQEYIQTAGRAWPERAKSGLGKESNS